MNVLSRLSRLLSVVRIEVCTRAEGFEEDGDYEG